MMNIVKNGVEIKNCVWFGAEDMFSDIEKNSVLDIAFKLKLETFKNKYQYKIYIEDIKPSEKEEKYINEKFLREQRTL